jgi:hypothetical protein
MELCCLQVNEWNIMLSEVSQVQKDKGHMLFSYMWDLDLKTHNMDVKGELFGEGTSGNEEGERRG